MRVWAGKQKKGAIVEGEWKGAEPLWNIGIHIRSEEVKQGLKISEVENTIANVLKGNFSSYKLVISPKAREVLEGKHDGLSDG
jgi:hypothetical protein